MPTRKADLKGLTLLGRPARPGKDLETFPNRHPDRRYTVTLASDEFTCVCPLTGQPDFATITIRYIPDRRILESKSLKLYLWSYRDEGVFHEHVTNTICDDLVKALDPHWIEVTGAFKARGGIALTVVATHEKASTVKRPARRPKGKA
jgi:7-cyano-7-deazaguanine reductase